MAGIRTPDHAEVYAYLRRLEGGLDVVAPEVKSLPYPGSGYGSGGGSSSSWWGSVVGGNPLGANRGPREANYPLLAGRLDRCAVVAACLRWMTTNFVQARLQVTVPDARGRDKPLVDSPFVRFMRSPCPRIAPGSERRIYSAEDLWAVTLIALKTRRKAYWVKVRRGGPRGPVEGVKWVPDCHLRPVVAPGVTAERYIEGYVYRVGNMTPLPIPIDDVVHFRDGLDLDDQREGWGALMAGLAQIVALNGGTATTAGLLTNMGIPPVIFTGTDTHPLDEPAARAIERRYNGGTSGANAGIALAFEQPINAQTIGLSPEDLALDRILQGPTAEICALLGLRPLAVGLSDDRGTYENEAQANSISWRDCLVPLQKALAGTLQEQLYPDFGDPERETVAWDYSDVQSLKEDEAARIERSARAFEARMISFNQAAEAAGWEPREGGEDVYSGDEYPWSAAAAEEEPEEGAGEDEDFEWPDEEEPDADADADAEAKGILSTVGLRFRELKALEAEDLAELFTGRELKALAAAPRGAELKRVGAARRVRRDKAKGKGKGGGRTTAGRHDPNQHPRGEGGRFADVPGRGNDAPRHVRLARAAAKAERSHRELRARGERGPEYDRQLDRSIRLKRAAEGARRERAQELYRLRSGDRTRQGRLELKPGAKSPRQAPGRGTAERGRTADRLKGARAKARERAAERMRADAKAEGKPDPATHTDHKPGHIGEQDTDLIHFDPNRFQYKLAQTDHSTGSVGSLAGVRKWDPELAGVVSVWKDPGNGKVFVVNGHNRLDLAKKLGVDRVAVRYLDAPNAEMARAKGALANIAEGRGTSLDAAKFFRDSGIRSKSELVDRGIPLTEGKTNEGLALSGLSNPLFRRVIDGTIPAEKGAIIGGGGLADSQQTQLAALYDKQKGNVTSNQLREWVDESKDAGVRTKAAGPSLFGKDDGPDEESLFLHRTSLNAHVRERLSREKKLFGTVSRQRSAETLQRGGNVIDTEASGKISRDADEALNVFGTLKRTSVFSGAANDYAGRMAGARGDAQRQAIRDDYYREVLDRVRNAYDLSR